MMPRRHQQQRRQRRQRVVSHPVFCYSWYLFFFLLLSPIQVFVVVVVNASTPSPGYPPCYICGSSQQQVSNSDAIVQFPGQPPVTCASLQLGGVAGFIEPNICPVFGVFGVPQLCGCLSSSPSSSSSTTTNTNAPAPATVVATPIPTRNTSLNNNNNSTFTVAPMVSPLTSSSSSRSIQQQATQYRHAWTTIINFNQFGLVYYYWPAPALLLVGIFSFSPWY